MATYAEAQEEFERTGGNYLRVIEAARAELDAKVAALDATTRAEWEALLVANEWYDGEVEIQLGALTRLLTRYTPDHQPGKVAARVWFLGTAQCMDCGRECVEDTDRNVWLHR